MKKAAFLIPHYCVVSAVMLGGIVVAGVPAKAPDACADERDKIIGEYIDAHLEFTPVCGEFIDAISSAHFTFAELNTGDYPWAILREALLDGIEETRKIQGGIRMIVNSGYRNPRRNAKISGSGLNSRHLHGDAVDIRADESSWNLIVDGGKAAGACAEPQRLSGFAHVHLDWRGKCPAGW